MRGLIAAASGGGSGANYEKFSNPSEDDGDGENHSGSSSPNLLEKVYLEEALEDEDDEEDAVPFNVKESIQKMEKQNNRKKVRKGGSANI